MDWTWNSPIALGLFLLLCGATLMMLAMAVAVIAGKAKVADLPLLGLWRR